MLALAMSASLSFAAELPWVSTAVRGTVIYLAGDKWEEVSRDQDLTTASIRTLRSGHLSAAASGLVLEIGPSTVLELGSSKAAGGSQVRHYIGTLTISGLADTPADVVLQAGRVVVTSIQGEVQVTVTSDATTLAVHSGSILVRGTGGALSVMTAGTYVTTEAGVLVAMADMQGDGTTSLNQVGFAGSRGAGAGGNSDNGNGSGSNSGNGPGTNNGNGPGANNGNGQSTNNGIGPGGNSGSEPGTNSGHGPAENNGNGGTSGGGNGNAGGGQENGANNGNTDPGGASNGNGGKKKDTDTDTGTDDDLPVP
jgi:hypothetical protein